jgi:nicotinamidase-related amidase
LTIPLIFPGQYYRLYDPAKPYGCNESNFGAITETLELPIEETALILCNCWNQSASSTHRERALRIMHDHIQTALHAARAAGLTIVHAPTPRIAEKYTHLNPYIEPGDKELFPRFGERDPEWPPADFYQRTEGYAGFKRDYQVPWDVSAEKFKTLDFDPIVAPIQTDFVISTASQLCRLLAHKKILHLIYAGFATNGGMLRRDYSVSAMAWLGYNPIVLRDCTTADEYHDTVDQLMATHVTLRWFEYALGYTALEADFTQACQANGE